MDTGGESMIDCLFWGIVLMVLSLALTRSGGEARDRGDKLAEIERRKRDEQAEI